MDMDMDGAAQAEMGTTQRGRRQRVWGGVPVKDGVVRGALLALKNGSVGRKRATSCLESSIRVRDA